MAGDEPPAAGGPTAATQAGLLAGFAGIGGDGRWFVGCLGGGLGRCLLSGLRGGRLRLGCRLIGLVGLLLLAMIVSCLGVLLESALGVVAVAVDVLLGDGGAVADHVLKELHRPDARRHRQASSVMMGSAA